MGLKTFHIVSNYTLYLFNSNCFLLKSVNEAPLTDEEIEELLTKLTSEEIEKLLEDTDPDDEHIPPSARQKSLKDITKYYYG